MRCLVAALIVALILPLTALAADVPRFSDFASEVTRRFGADPARPSRAKAFCVCTEQSTDPGFSQYNRVGVLSFKDDFMSAARIKGLTATCLVQTHDEATDDLDVGGNPCFQFLVLAR